VLTIPGNRKSSHRAKAPSSSFQLAEVLGASRVKISPNASISIWFHLRPTWLRGSNAVKPTN